MKIVVKKSMEVEYNLNLPELSYFEKDGEFFYVKCKNERLHIVGIYYAEKKGFCIIKKYKEKDILKIQEFNIIEGLLFWELHKNMTNFINNTANISDSELMQSNLR